jgi:hypothetical protein
MLGLMAAGALNGVKQDAVASGASEHLQQRACKVSDGESGVALAPMPLLDLPPDLQRDILGRVPLRKVAQLAFLNTELHSVYLDRVTLRDAVIVGLVEGHFPPEYSTQLSSTQMALPRDFLFDPPVRPPCFLP